MKYTAPFLLLLFLLSCYKKGKEEIVNLPNDSCGKQLYEKGFLKFSDSLEMDSLRAGLINSFDIYNEKVYKIAHIDAEALAEFNFDFFIPQLNLILEKRGFKLNIHPANDYPVSNEVFINSMKVKLYTAEELENGDFWETASRNFFKAINKQLNNQGMGEMFYLLYGGNDLHVMLLSEVEQIIIAEHYKNESKEIPSLP